MASTPQPPARPPQSGQPPARPQAPHPGEPSRPLQPPLPAAQSSPPRQPPPAPTPQPDAPRDQRYREGEDRDMPTTLTPEQRTALVTEPHPPQKFKRPLPQPGDPDYVQGQPVNEEEAARVEREDEERFARGLEQAQQATARRQDVRTDEQHPGSPPPKHPEGERHPLKDNKSHEKDRP